MSIFSNGYVHIILSSVAVYIFILFAIRLFGKKELAQLSVVDLVFILLISNSVQNAMVGSNSSLLGGLAAASALFATNYVFKYFLFISPRFNRFVQGKAILLIYEGKLMEKNLLRARITYQEMTETIREHGLSKIEDVNLAVLEVDGSISVLSNDYQKKTTHTDKLNHLKGKQPKHEKE